MGYINRNNANNENLTDRQAVADLVADLREMLNARRTNGTLLREEFMAVATLSWFHLTLEFDTLVVQNLTAQAQSPGDRLRKIASLVGMQPSRATDAYFRLAEPLSLLLIFIENTVLETLGVELLYDGTSPFFTNMAQSIVSNFEKATGRPVKTAWNTHGDIVVEVTGNSISAIGGNLSDSVGQASYTLGSNGLIVQPSGCRLIAVLRPPGGGGAPTPPTGSPPSYGPPPPSTGGDLRSRVGAAVRRGLIPQQVGNMILGGDRNEVQLANTMFYTAHPELPPNYQIKANETAWAQEWLRYRDVVRTLLSGV